MKLFIRCRCRPRHHTFICMLSVIWLIEYHEIIYFILFILREKEQNELSGWRRREKRTNKIITMLIKLSQPFHSWMIGNENENGNSFVFHINEMKPNGILPSKKRHLDLSYFICLWIKQYWYCIISRLARTLFSKILSRLLCFISNLQKIENSLKNHKKCKIKS